MDDVLRQVLTLFNDEFKEHSLAMAQSLIQAERAESVEERKGQFAEIFRRAHSVKGTSGTLGLFDLEELAHAMETSLTEFRSGERKMPPGLAQKILGSLDKAQRHLETAIASGDESAPELKAAAAELLRAAAGGPPPPTATPVPTRPATPMPRASGERPSVPLAASAPLPTPAPARPPEATHPTPAPDHKAEPKPVPSVPTPPAQLSPPQEAGQPARFIPPLPPPAETGGPTPDVPSRPEEIGTRRLGAAEVLRVSSERVFSLERQLDDLREIRAAVDQRSDDARRIYWTLVGALSRGTQDVEHDLAAAIRDQILQLQRDIAGAAGELAFRVAEIDDELRSLRMLPVDTLLAPLAKSVWEHASSVGKRVRLETFGAKVALDRRMLQELKDPFVHLVRNAVDHGVEMPNQRVAAGKPKEGVVRIDVEQRGNSVQFAISDDGAGIDATRVRATAVENRMLTPEAAAALPEEELQQLIFTPGFSTSPTVSRTSGRGVGLDVVKENVQKVGGRVSVSTRPGKGSRFVIEVPLTLATAQALLFEASGFMLAVPLSSVVRARFVDSTEAGRGSIEMDGQLLPIHAMSEVLQVPVTRVRHNGFSVVVLRSAERLLAIRVEQLLGEREVVVRPLPPEMLRLRHLSAATALGDGRLAFILSPRALVEALGAQASFAALTETARKHRVVVADDSITTRSLHRQVLEAAGYHVETAADGEEALRLLRSKGADLLVSDVHMPRMDGLTLTRRVRAEPSLGGLPVVLVSSLDSDADQKRARDAGASAYLPKGAYQRGELLKLVQALLPS